MEYLWLLCWSISITLSLPLQILTRPLIFIRKFWVWKPITFEGRKALAFGIQRIDLHQRGHEFNPKSAHPTPGSADLCFLTNTPLADVIAYLTEQRVHIEEGPVERNGAIGKLRSIYVRDPDRNLIEISNTL